MIRALIVVLSTVLWLVAVLCAVPYLLADTDLARQLLAAAAAAVLASIGLDVHLVRTR